MAEATMEISISNGSTMGAFKAAIEDATEDCVENYGNSKAEEVIAGTHGVLEGNSNGLVFDAVTSATSDETNDINIKLPTSSWHFGVINIYDINKRGSDGFGNQFSTAQIFIWQNNGVFNKSLSTNCLQTLSSNGSATPNALQYISKVEYNGTTLTLELYRRVSSKTVSAANLHIDYHIW